MSTAIAIPSDLPPICKRIICIGGFLQGRHQRTGLERIWQHLRARHEKPTNGCHVSLHSWNEDWPAFVLHCLRTGPRDVSLFDIRIVAYSWGVGYGAMSLANLLQDEGIAVRKLASCDGVYRSRFALWRSMWSPLLGEPSITVPANVQEVHYVRQQENRPHGHRLRAAVPGKTMIVNHGYVEGVTHSAIDNSLCFQRLAIAAAE